MGSPPGAGTGTTTTATTTAKPKPKPKPPPAKTWEDTYSAADRGTVGSTGKPDPKPQTTSTPQAPAARSSAPQDSFVQRQKSIDALSTASPYASKAMQAELNNDITQAQSRVAELDRGIDALGTSSGYVTDAMRAERDYVAADLAAHHTFTNPPPAPPTPVSGSDRRFYVEAADRADDPSILEDFDANLQAYNDSQKLPEITVGSDRRFYAQAADLKDDPSILQDFDDNLEKYNSFKNAVAQTYDSRVNDLMNQHGYDRTVAEDLVTLEFQNSGLPTHALPEQARGLNFENRNEGSDRRLHAMSDDPDALREFDAGSPEYRQFREAIGEKFDDAVDEMVKDSGYDRDVAQRLVALQFGALGVPSHALPDGVNTFDPGKVLQQKHDVFDTANHAVDGRSITFSEVINRTRGRENGGDGFTATSDIDAIVDNPDKFDPDVVATAIVLQDAINRPGNEDFKAQFESTSLWQQVKDSDWNDWNSDSLVVNFVNAASGRPVSPAFIQRVWNEGPDVAGKIGDSLYELSTINQVRLAFTDRDQLLDNYKSFGGGAKDWVIDTAKLGIGLTALGTPGGAEALKAATGTDVRQVAIDTVLSTGETLINDPDALAKGIVGWDQFVDDPWRWAGNQAPDIVLEILGTKGAGKFARAARGADAAQDAAGAGQKASRLADAKQGVEGVFDYGKAFVDNAKQIGWALDRDVQAVVADAIEAAKAGGRRIKAGAEATADLLTGGPNPRFADASSGGGLPKNTHAASVGGTPNSGAPSPSGPSSAPEGNLGSGKGANADDALPPGGQELDFDKGEFSPSYQNGWLQGAAAADRGGEVIKSFKFGDDAPYDFAHVVDHHADGSRSVFFEYADGRIEAGPKIDKPSGQDNVDTPNVDTGRDAALNDGLKELGLPTEGTVTFDPGKAKNIEDIKRRRGEQGGYLDNSGNEWKWDPIKEEWDVTLSDRGKTDYGGYASGKNKNHVNVDNNGNITHQT